MGSFGGRGLFWREEMVGISGGVGGWWRLGMACFGRS